MALECKPYTYWWWIQKCRMVRTASFCIALSLYPFLSLGQSATPNKNLLPTKSDSCHLVLYDVLTREMMTIPHRHNDLLPVTNLERKTEIGHVTISISDMNKLIKRISQKSSYKNSRAMLTHSNIYFELFSNQSAVVKISISSISGNIDILNTSNDQEFHGGVSKKFGKYLFDLLEKYKVLSSTVPFELLD